MGKLSAVEYANLLISKIQELIKTEDIKLLYQKDSKIDDDYIKDVAEIKRFLELWSADPKVREIVTKEPVTAKKKLNLNVNPMDSQSFWDSNAQTDQLPPLNALRYRSFLLEKLTYRNQIRRGSENMNQLYKSWRARQILRLQNQLSPQANEGIVHAPFTIELSHGCSVGCWFCGLKAPKLTDIYRYNEENADLYRGVLKVLKDIFEDNTGHGFCYWATEPFDNPDYEKFLIDFYEITNRFPQTTTAIPVKDTERTRKLLNLSREKGGHVERFSISSLKLMYRLFEEFSAEELLFVEVLAQNSGGIINKSNSGRVRETNNNDSKLTSKKEIISDGTIACVSGFLINMVDRSVKLISPCQADEKWPLGYIVYDEGIFTTVEDFRELVYKLINKHMQPQLQSSDIVEFYDYLEYEELSGGFALKGKFVRKNFIDNPGFSVIGKLISKGTLAVDQILDIAIQEYNLSLVDVLYLLNLLYQNGVLKIKKDAIISC